MSLQEDNQRLKKAREHIAFCKEAEIKAIKDLLEARQRLSRSREKYEELFYECEARAVKHLDELCAKVRKAIRKATK